MFLLADAQELAFLPEVVALLLSCVAVTYLCQRVRLVPIVAFLLTGVLVGPNSLGLVRSLDTVQTLAQVGVMLLLFSIGMEFSLDEVIRLTRLILVGGGLQTGLTVVFTAGLLALAGVDWPAGLFTGCLIALSSDALALKVLADRGETNTPAGRATLAILVFQDLAAVAMMLVVPFLAGRGGSFAAIGLALFKAVGTIVLVLTVARRLMPRLLELVARTCQPELFLLTVTAICFGTAWLTSLAGLDLSLGAFLAGLVLSGSRLKDLAFGEVLPLRTLFSAAFFVSLGMLLDPRFLFAHPGLVLAAVVLVLGMRLATTALGLAALGQPPRVMLVTALLLAQVGEFAFVLQQFGRKLGLEAAGMGEVGSQAFIASSVLLMVLTPGFVQAARWLDGWLQSRGQTGRARRRAGGGPSCRPRKAPDSCRLWDGGPGPGPRPAVRRHPLRHPHPQPGRGRRGCAGGVAGPHWGQQPGARPAPAWRAEGQDPGAAPTTCRRLPPGSRRWPGRSTPRW